MSLVFLQYINTEQEGLMFTPLKVVGYVRAFNCRNIFFGKTVILILNIW